MTFLQRNLLNYLENIPSYITLYLILFRLIIVFFSFPNSEQYLLDLLEDLMEFLEMFYGRMDGTMNIKERVVGIAAVN